MQKALLILILAVSPLFLSFASGQESIYLSRYIGNNYLEDPFYRLEIFNPTESVQDVSGYMIASRQYVVLLPAGVQIPPLSRLSLGKSGSPGGPIDVDFAAVGDFIIRIPSSQEQGDYVVLMDRRRNIVDAFYFSPLPIVNFLPDEGKLITFQSKEIPFEVPEEQRSIWKYLQVSPDPAMAFIRINDQWQATSRTRNTLPATAFGVINGKYVNGVVAITCSTLFERDCLPHELERSEDGLSFLPATTLPSHRNAPDVRAYRFYDDQIQPNLRYYYRVKNRDRFGQVTYSQLVEVRTDEVTDDFQIEVFLGQQAGGNSLNVRFSTRDAQAIRIKLLDEQFRELSLLFYDQLAAFSQNLIKYTGPLPAGKYFIVADTDGRRYYEELIVR